MSSTGSEAYTPPPGVLARSRPTSKASAATIDGTRGGAARSVASARRPRTALPPPVSMIAFQAVGLSSGLLRAAGDQVGKQELQARVVPPAEFGPGHQRLGRPGRRQVGLDAAPQDRISG